MTDHLTRAKQLLALTTSPEREEARTAAELLAKMLHEGKVRLATGEESGPGRIPPRDFRRDPPQPARTSEPRPSRPWATADDLKDFWPDFFQKPKTQEQRNYEKGWDATFGNVGKWVIVVEQGSYPIARPNYYVSHTHMTLTTNEIRGTMFPDEATASETLAILRRDFRQVLGVSFRVVPAPR